ncbi:fimbrial protein [Hafnia alvei]|jgi:type 1 fimbria pilin|uniref:fimbrial protein n=1 Tax=Hafnia alvei TaxID=569 RepID=UPI000E03D2C2|nr:fimbrial protein [Hafnia alvei]STQ70805.1 Fimbria A protein precursor [Hafnia alvei]
MNNLIYQRLSQSILSVILITTAALNASSVRANNDLSFIGKITHRSAESDASPVNAIFHGELVEDPCVVSTESETQDIEFGQREKTFFYIHSDNPVTTPIAFNLVLKECDLTLGKKVKVSLIGDDDSEDPGYLRIKGQAEGVAIGLASTQDGTVVEMPINTGITYFLHDQSDNILTFQAYLKGNPKRIEKRTIVEGDFTAIAEFQLEYD